MNYDRPDLLDRLAAEYVLGSMTLRARRRFERLRVALPSAEAAARDWERRLMPLSDAVPVEAPPAGTWQSIDRRTGGAAARDPRSAARAAGPSWMAWLKPALGFAFGVVATIGLLRVDPGALLPIDAIVQQRGTLPPSYVGLLTDAQNNPVLLLSSTRQGRLLSIKRLVPVDVPAGAVPVLWALPRDGAPFALGALPAGDHAVLMLADTSEKLFANVPRLAVSLERAAPAPGAAPAAFLLSGHCVKLW